MVNMVSDVTKDLNENDFAEDWPQCECDAGEQPLGPWCRGGLPHGTLGWDHVGVSHRRACSLGHQMARAALYDSLSPAQPALFEPSPAPTTLFQTAWRVCSRCQARASRLQQPARMRGGID